MAVYALANRRLQPLGHSSNAKPLGNISFCVNHATATGAANADLAVQSGTKSGTHRKKLD